MNIDFEENDDTYEQSEEENVDWKDYAYQQEEQPALILDRKDYIALFIASLQTIMLPVITLLCSLLLCRQ